MNVVPKETLFYLAMEKTHKENSTPPRPYHCYYSLLTIIYKAYKEMVLGSADTNNPFF